jgi:cytidine 5'monophosphate N-acetylneuraminic acid synthetase
MDNLLLVIPAIKKNAVIPDQLVRKLNGVTLFQRAINTALDITNKILVVTDSEEISLICDRNGINFYKDKDLRLNSENILEIIYSIVKSYKEDNIFLYRANTPLVDSEILKDAYATFKRDSLKILMSVKSNNKNIFFMENDTLKPIERDVSYGELKAFYIFSKKNLALKDFKPYILDSEKCIEIESYQDWWVCEKILRRKRIVFNVIGDSRIGMGHIYRSLTIAKEINDHEIIFVCDEKYNFAVNNIASKYHKVFSSSNVLKTILDLKPDLVINDCLNNDEMYIHSLKNANVKIVSFEDISESSRYVDLVFNELFEIPQKDGKNYFWGHKYTLLRDEFDDAKRNDNFKNVNSILLSFGGSDPNNLTLKALKSILKICMQYELKINIVCGSAYAYEEELKDFIANCKYKNIFLFINSVAMSKIMEECQIAISSNGRTAYELADMHIPTIVISHHEREATHTFTSLQNGFINLGIFDKKTAIKLEEKFKKLVEDIDYRELLFNNIKKYDFRSNKNKVISKILELL